MAGEGDVRMKLVPEDVYMYPLEWASNVEPHRRLDVQYNGKLCVLADPQEMVDPARAFKNNPGMEADICLAFEGVSPMFGGETVELKAGY